MMLRKIVSGIPIKTLPHTTGSPNPRQGWSKRVRTSHVRQNRSPLFKFKHSLLTCFTDAELSKMERAIPRHLFLGCTSEQSIRSRSLTISDPCIFHLRPTFQNSPRLEIHDRWVRNIFFFFLLNLSPTFQFDQNFNLYMRDTLEGKLLFSLR